VPPTLLATTVYDLQTATDVLGLRRSTLRREIRLKRLRAAKRAGKVMILGRWLIDWIEGGPPPSGRAGAAGQQHAAAADTADTVADRRPGDAGDGRGPGGPAEGDRP
jgi:hypothetical protein